MTADASIVVAVRGDVSGGRVIKRNLDEIANAGDKATTAQQRLERQLGNLNRAANLLKTAFVGMIGAMGLNELRRISDSWTTLETQLRNVTRTTREYEGVLRGLFSTAQRNGDVFTGLASTYVQLNNSLPETIRKTTDLVKVTELLSRGFAISGTNAQTAAAASLQLTQGLSSNFSAAAQELNSLIEGAPLLARIIAEQLGGRAATDLKRFAEEGKLTAENFLQALMSAEEAIASFDIPPTIDRSWQRLQNRFLMIVGNSDSVQGAARNIAGAIDDLAASLDDVVKISGVLAATAIPAVAMSVTRLLIPAFTALGTVILANPLFTAASLLTGAVAAIVLYREEIVKLAREFDIFGTPTAQIFAFLSDSVMGTFAGSLEVIKGWIAAIRLSLFDLVEDMNRMPGINIDPTMFVGSDVLEIMRLGGRSAAENFQAGFDRATSNGFLARELSLSGLPSSTGALPPASPAAPGGSSGSVQGLEAAQKRLAALIKETYTDQERYNATVRELENLRGFAKTAEEIRAIDRAIVQAGKDLDKIRLEAELDSPLAKNFKRLFNEIDDGFKDAFKDAFTESDGGFKRLIEGWKATFKNFLAEIAYAALARPIVLSVVGGVGGAMGLSGSAMASITGQAGGGGMGFGNLLSLGKSGFSALSGGIGNLGFGGTTINSFGAGLGFAPGATSLGPGVFGPAAQAGSLTGATLGATLGAAGLGFAGGSLLASLTGGNQMGGGIGGAGGAAIGMMVGGPVGALIGGLGGSLVGGMFGGDGLKRQTLGVNIGANNGLLSSSGASTKGGNVADAQKFGNAVTQALNALVTSIGAEFVRGIGTLETNFGEKDPGTFLFQGGRKTQLSSKPGDVNSVIRAILGNDKFISGGDAQLTSVLRKSFGMGSSPEQALSDVMFAKEVMALGTDINPLTQALDALNEQFDAMRDRAEKLGLPLEKINEAYDKQKQGVTESLLHPLQAFLDNQALSGSSSLSHVDRLSLARSSFDQNLSAIKSGDYSRLGNITSQASQLLDVGRNVFASGQGFAALESYVRQSIAGIAGDLGAPGALNDSVTRQMSQETARQTSILEQMNLELKELREENRKLRKAMERVGNAVVVQS